MPKDLAVLLTGLWFFLSLYTMADGIDRMQKANRSRYLTEYAKYKAMEIGKMQLYFGTLMVVLSPGIFILIVIWKL